MSSNQRSQSLRVIPSLHSALDGKHRFGANQPIASDVTPPLHRADFGEGGPLAYLLRSAGQEVLFLDTANFIERDVHHNSCLGEASSLAIRFAERVSRRGLAVRLDHRSSHSANPSATPKAMPERDVTRDHQKTQGE